MNRTAKLLVWAAAGALIIMMLTSCNAEGKKTKQQVLEALHKQAEIKSYTFDGYTELQLRDTFPVTGTNPLTAILIGSLTTGKLEWSGVANNNPAQLESKLKITPSGSPAWPDMPILIKDNKLYTQIPLINPKNEYVSMDLSNTASGLAKASQTYARMAQLLFESFEAKWFITEARNLGPSSEGSFVWNSVKIDKSNVKKLSTVLQGILPQWADLLANDGILTKSQSDSLKTSLTSKTVTLQPDGYVRLAVGKNGFAEELQTDLSFVLEEKGVTSSIQRIKLVNSWSKVNEPSAFTQTVPTQAKSLEELLKPFVK